MRPTIEEQLTALVRILREVVVPAVNGDYPRDIATEAAATLETLAKGWADVPAFLAWDAARTAELLRDVGVETPQPPAEPLDLRALAAHHAALRAMLAEHIAEVSTDGAVAHFRERASRYPIRP